MAFNTLQEICPLFNECFHWILSEFISPTKQDVMGIQWIQWSTKQRLIACTFCNDDSIFYRHLTIFHPTQSFIYPTSTGMGSLAL